MASNKRWCGYWGFLLKGVYLTRSVRTDQTFGRCASQNELLSSRAGTGAHSPHPVGACYFLRINGITTTTLPQAAHTPTSDALGGIAAGAASSVMVEAPEGSVVVDQSILDESGRMLEFLQKENAKYRSENANLHREVTKIGRENSHLKHSTETAETTMKVLT